MPKSVIQDIVKSSKKPSVSRPGPVKAEKIWNNFNIKGQPRLIIDRNDGGSKIALWVIAAISFIFLVFAFSTLFTAATITIYPKESAYTLLDSNFKAEKESLEAVGANGAELTFEVMSLEGSLSKSLPAPKVVAVEKKATGKAVIYNDFSKESQKLIVNTRLQTPDGKIYRIDEAVTVPGQSVSSGAAVPGSVPVSIHAGEAGEEYNLPFADFTIPGFKGGPKYEKFYARSIGEIGGGIKGTAHVVLEKDALAARNEMTTVLKDTLTKKAKLEVPKGFVLYDDAIFFEPTLDNLVLESKETFVPIKLSGKVYGIILDESKLSLNIAKSSIKDFENDEVVVAGLGDLNFSIKNRGEVKPENVKELSFSLSGQGKIIWKIDEEKLKDDLLGKSKKQLQGILANFPNIEKAEATIKPFWKSTFPGRKQDITVINTSGSLK